MTNTEIELRQYIRTVIYENLSEEDVFGNTSSNDDSIEDALQDFESDIKTADLSGNENEAVGITLAGVALSGPERIKIFVRR